MMDGWVKILYLKVYGGIFGCCDLDGVVMEQYGIKLIDLVVVNLYFFEVMVVRFDCDLFIVIENIDIGGLIMVCLVVKNYKDVVIVVNVGDYVVVIEFFKVGGLIYVQCFDLVFKVFEYIFVYDGMIVNYLGIIDQICDILGIVDCGVFLCIFNSQFVKVQEMCYGENLYQSVVFYVEVKKGEVSVFIVIQLQGKELLFNNVVDIDVVLECVKSFFKLVCVIVKYVNFCGVVVVLEDEGGICKVYDLVYVIDSELVFGGIIVFNCELDGEIVKVIVECQFVEVIIVLKIFVVVCEVVVVKVNVCLFECGEWLVECVLGWDFKWVNGGLLVQSCDIGMIKVEDLKIVICCVFIEQEIYDLIFVWKVVKFVKFNVIVYVRNCQIVGVGVGQMSWVNFVWIVVIKVEYVGLEVKGVVMVFDVFFLFCDGIDNVVKVGIIVVIQLGGLMCDNEVIVVVDEVDIVMVFIGMCYFCY